jgi:hypothetical protein
LARIGRGEPGGKARGLVRLRDALRASGLGDRFPGLRIDVPDLTILTTDVFETFLVRNAIRASDLVDRSDDRIAHLFLKGSLPTEILGSLRSLAEQSHLPLAVRSSGLLEDDQELPLAGAYVTKMLPNDQPDPRTRFARLSEAVKLVYASTFFAEARRQREAIAEAAVEEKMAVIVQEVVGSRRGARFYPHVSLVARSRNVYPVGTWRPEEGIAHLALGLGKTIVDGGVTWPFVPSRPLAPPPFASLRDRLKNTQLDYWAIRMGTPPPYDPGRASEYLVRGDLATAEQEGTLRLVASTYDGRSDRLVPGLGIPGPRIIDFAPLLTLRTFPLAEAVVALLRLGEEALDEPVEIEAALSVQPGEAGSARLGLLQVRPISVSDEPVEIPVEDMTSPRALVVTNRCTGHGTRDDIRDVVYVRPDRFNATLTPQVAIEVGRIDARLTAEARPYLLIGFGRWGSSDPFLGVPVAWGQIHGARAIVEVATATMNVDPSQGSHFFHNLTSHRVAYFHVPESAATGVDWPWLSTCEAVEETDLVRHVRTDEPLLVKVDGTRGRGGVWRGRP